jgi:outer membrane protein OmpA-like peptidoglycan-associated protein
MRNRSIQIGVLALLMVVGVGATDAAVQVTGVEFLSKSVTVPFTAQSSAPKAELSADVVFKLGQSRVKLKYKDLSPAILFGGDITSYVLWAVTADGRATNLGELQQNGKTSGTETFYVGLKGFAMIVTAEPYFMVARPSVMVMFIGGPPEKDKSRFASYAFAGLAMAPRHDVESIDGQKWESEESLLLMQARKAYEIAGRYRADNRARAAYVLAGEELDTAEAAASKGSGGKELDNAARNAVQLSNTAINIAVRSIAGEQIAKMVALRQRELNNANERSEAAEMAVAMLANQQVQLASTLDEVESENIELQSLLRGALSSVASTRIEAARIVLTLPGIVFDTEKATLKPEAKLGLAKLSGILMVFHRARVNVGGYTDSTGKEDYNIKLSGQRAEAVMDFLVEQGVAEGRLTANGFGAVRPVADNATKDGRAENRRVEMVIIARN